MGKTDHGVSYHRHGTGNSLGKAPAQHSQEGVRRRGLQRGWNGDEGVPGNQAMVGKAERSKNVSSSRGAWAGVAREGLEDRWGLRDTIGIMGDQSSPPAPQN